MKQRKTKASTLKDPKRPEFSEEVNELLRRALEPTEQGKKGKPAKAGK